MFRLRRTLMTHGGSAVLSLLLTASCTDRPLDPGSGPSFRIINASPGDNLQAKIDSAEPGDAVRLDAGTFSYGGSGSFVVLRKKSSITIFGKGPATVLSLGPRARFGIEIRDSVQNVRIESLAIAGAGAAADTNTRGVGSPNDESAIGVRNITIADLQIRDVAVGIILITSASGEYDSVTIARNLVENIRGTEPMTGYGIVNHVATRVRIVNNEIRYAQRHAIYQGASKGPADVVIDGNFVYGAGGNYSHPRAAAVAIARSRRVTAVNNVIMATQAPNPALSIE